MQRFCFSLSKKTHKSIVNIGMVGDQEEMTTTG